MPNVVNKRTNSNLVLFFAQCQVILEQLLKTKHYIPPIRLELVPRPRLVRQLNEGIHVGRKLTLISAPAGFGKTTLAVAWLDHLTKNIQESGAVENKTAWLSLDVRGRLSPPTHPNG